VAIPLTLRSCERVQNQRERVICISPASTHNCRRFCQPSRRGCRSKPRTSTPKEIAFLAFHDKSHYFDLSGLTGADGWDDCTLPRSTVAGRLPSFSCNVGSTLYLAKSEIRPPRMKELRSNHIRLEMFETRSRVNTRSVSSARALRLLQDNWLKVLEIRPEDLIRVLIRSLDAHSEFKLIPLRNTSRADSHVLPHVSQWKFLVDSEKVRPFTHELQLTGTGRTIWWPCISEVPSRGRLHTK